MAWSGKNNIPCLASPLGCVVHCIKSAGPAVGMAPQWNKSPPAQWNIIRVVRTSEPESSGSPVWRCPKPPFSRAARDRCSVVCRPRATASDRRSGRFWATLTTTSPSNSNQQQNKRDSDETTNTDGENKRAGALLFFRPRVSFQFALFVLLLILEWTPATRMGMNVLFLEFLEILGSDNAQ